MSLKMIDKNRKKVIEELRGVRNRRIGKGNILDEITFWAMELPKVIRKAQMLKLFKILRKK